MNKVIEPKYCGTFQEAIQDLMQKAVEEQKRNKSEKSEKK
jgi:hypothetical protein